jgi:hypothetical protein
MVKISTHCFHSLYLFDRDDSQKKFVDDKGPTHLLAEWPIFDRIPKAQRQDSGEFEEYSDLKKFLELKTKTTRPADAICNNYFSVKLQDIGSSRGAFHGLLRSIKTKQDIKLDSSGSSDGVLSRTCCKEGGATATAVYEEGGGHCCDDAVFGFIVDSRNIGTINLNNLPGCGSVRSGPFSISPETIAKRVFPVEVTCQTGGRCHSGITTIIITDQAGGRSGSIGLSEGKSCLEICLQPEGEFNSSLCCCPPKHIKEQKENVDGDSFVCNEYEESTNYQCSRSHSSNLQINFEFDGSKIFNLQELSSLLDASRLISIVDSEPVLKDGKSRKEMGAVISASSSAGGGSFTSSFSDFSVTSTGGDNAIYRNDWEFIGDGSFRQRLRRASVSNYHLVKDPILGYPREIIGYSYSFFSPFDRGGGFLDQKIDYSNSRFHSIKIKGDNKSYSHTDMYDETLKTQDTLSYNSNCRIIDAFFSESQKEYFFILDFNSSIVVSNMNNVHWNAGNYRGARVATGPEGGDEDSKDRSDFAGINWENKFNFRSVQDTPLKFSTNPESFLGEAFSESAWEKKKRESDIWLSKDNIDVNLKLGGTTRSTQRSEFFKYEKNTAEHKDPEEESETPSKCDLKLDVKANWTNKISVEVESFKDSDFSNQLLIPTI